MKKASLGCLFALAIAAAEFEIQLHAEERNQFININNREIPIHGLGIRSLKKCIADPAYSRVRPILQRELDLRNTDIAAIRRRLYAENSVQ